MQFSKNKNPFGQFFLAFLKSISNSEHFEKKDDSHNLGIFENTDYEICG